MELPSRIAALAQLIGAVRARKRAAPTKEKRPEAAQPPALSERSTRDDRAPQLPAA